MIEYEIHSVEYDQLPQCVETLHQAFGESAKRFGYTKETYPSSGAYITLSDLIAAKERGVHMYAACVCGKIAGYVQLEKTSDGVYAFRRFAVLPEYQQLGIGRALIAHCCARAERYGGKKMTLVMINENEKLKKFYQSNGFTVTKIAKDDSLPFEYCVMELDFI